MGLLHFLTTIFIVALFLSPPPTTAQTPPPSFKCTSHRQCQALVGYSIKNSTTLSAIQTLFQVKNLYTLLGANNLPFSTPRNHVLSPNTTLKIPFPCQCNNGTGMSDHVPVYKVAKDEFLFMIANDRFGGLVVYQQIQEVNHIKDASLIQIGQELWIPLPCSCDEVDGESVIHYGYVVNEGNTVSEIANKFETTPQTLMNVNGINDPKKLMAGQVLDVPLKVCSSSINNTSSDYPLLVPLNSSVVTANDCVMCTCPKSNNNRLNCEASGLKPEKWHTCPATQCSNELSLSNSTGSGCTGSTCTYTGYNHNSIFTALLNSCPPASPPKGNGASNMKMKGWRLGIGLGLGFVFGSLFL